jgi:hypothetical protein
VIANNQKQTCDNVSVRSPHQASTSITCTAMKNRRNPVPEGCGLVVVMTCGRSGPATQPARRVDCNQNTMAGFATNRG